MQRGSEFMPSRFIEAQDRVYADVLSELGGGAKRSHWMWYVFPQIAGLGRSAQAQYYALASLSAAEAYWAEPLLRERLLECTHLMLNISGKSAVDVLGKPDDLKFFSCMTLFSRVSTEPCFVQALEKYFDGKRDEGTLSRILASV